VSFFKKQSDYRDLIIFYKNVFSTPEGKRVLFDLMDRGDVLNTHGGDPFKEGRRSLVLEIMKKVKINIQELDDLLQQNEEKIG
jgi:hypothetical protein